jgi:phage baseplate assembly protein W
MNIAFPFAIGPDGRTATTSDEDHVGEMIEQLLLTNPGERVNRPDFGCGLYQLIFAPNSSAMAATVQVSLQGAVQRQLSDVLSLQDLNVTTQEERLMVVVNYLSRRSGASSATQVELAPGGA